MEQVNGYVDELEFEITEEEEEVYLELLNAIENSSENVGADEILTESELESLGFATGYVDDLCVEEEINGEDIGDYVTG